ncbi:MAG: hypothetical protein Q4F05_08420 [bacterium]|nr:hypothetical protein [bacterium]
MNEEITILEKMIPQLAAVMNFVPGERALVKDSDTLLILQRRMSKCDLQLELIKYNGIFAVKDGVSIAKLTEATISYIRIKVLVERRETEFNPRSYRELIKEYKALATKVNNIIHLTEVNSMTADEYQKEKIELVLIKNRALLGALHTEVERLEKLIERMPVIEEEYPVEESSSVSIKKKTRSSRKEMEERRFKFSKVIDRIVKRITKAREKRIVDERLINVQKEQSKTKCVEIPFYDKSLTFTEMIPCKDMPEYSLLKRRNNIYFGSIKNVGKTSYDNHDQSLLELTEASEEFLQFMSVELLTEQYVLKRFTEKEKEGLWMYFDFVSHCFQTHIGVTLTVQEYLQFKTYYNRLVIRMFELEKEEKEAYYRALMLADQYQSYMESYDLECGDEEETVITNIIHDKSEGYLEDLELIIRHHMVYEQAKEEVQKLVNQIRAFNTKDICEEHLDKKEQKTQIETVAPVLPYGGVGCLPQTFGIPAYPVGVNQGLMQIVIQILNQDKEIVDEALYAGTNIRQALYDYSTKEACIKRLGFRSNGADIFYKEEMNQ